ncbi:long-chain-fatty-acid--CoA ligase [Fulvimarina sp. 2208YS6-2-32]|uniref:Long-chain-fatty-acid--CoA ligase n=1 Tax=Fulvimarina uroteuthidis TaxID=3098149 RepID=A0ABU5HX90_9HYPH|nr:long-chain-fatty-acid--CoA ligase [Fulvimarina sp. 2208YS6-2-32]MDY8107591.1 long-chain-fatty-acid--CoA ligase [Fulvimarina sp. 2208YS6-2-32]
MQGLMQDRQLSISSLIEHAARVNAATPIVSRQIDGSIHRTTYAETAQRARQLANALRRIGVTAGDRIGTLAWNTHRHLELYYAISGSGAVCHTINPRLFIDQIQYIVDHAEDTVLFFDPTFTDLVVDIARNCGSVRTFVALCRREEMPDDAGLAGVLCYEELLAAEDDVFEWPEFPEETAAALCYTSGTTGHPKGVLYTHRSTILHAYASVMPDAFGISARDCVMPASSMYHANAWGLPYAAMLAGAKLVLPCNQLGGADITELVVAEAVTISCGVPTIWLGVLQSLEAEGRTLPTLRTLVVSGSACPVSLITRFRERHDVTIVHFWGMTELSPLGTIARVSHGEATLDAQALDEIRSRQGRPLYGVEIEIVGDGGETLAHDGTSFGDLMVRGWWVADGYFRQEGSFVDDKGWFKTGDVATIDADGVMRITDRSKDVIKSGGEWISSIDLENAAVGHPDVAEAAVIGIPHPKWDERPLLVAVIRPGTTPDAASIRDYLSAHVAKWQLPDDIVFVDEIPHTATGKILKTELREAYARHFLTRER